jgi:hypothetical protein
MKKKLWIFIAVLLVAFSVVLSVPVQAEPSENVSGLWRYQPFILDMQVIHGTTFLKTYENATWAGTFSGTSTEDGKVVIDPSGAWTFRGIVHFEGSVNGKSGRMTMYASGSRPDGFSDWRGTWEIKYGTGELADLHGQGDWWGPGAPGPEQWGDIYYSGNISFGSD